MGYFASIFLWASCLLGLTSSADLLTVKIYFTSHSALELVTSLFLLEPGFIDSHVCNYYLFYFFYL